MGSAWVNLLMCSFNFALSPEEFNTTTKQDLLCVFNEKIIYCYLAEGKCAFERMQGNWGFCAGNLKTRFAVSKSAPAILSLVHWFVSHLSYILSVLLWFSFLRLCHAGSLFFPYLDTPPYPLRSLFQHVLICSQLEPGRFV